MLDAPQKILQQREIEHRLRDGVFGAGFHFVFEAANFFVQIRTRPGLAPTPMTNAVPAPIGLPPISCPRFRLCTIFTSPMASTSKTAVASG